MTILLMMYGTVWQEWQRRWLGYFVAAQGSVLPLILTSRWNCAPAGWHRWSVSVLGRPPLATALCRAHGRTRLRHRCRHPRCPTAVSTKRKNMTGVSFVVMAMYGRSPECWVARGGGPSPAACRTTPSAGCLSLWGTPDPVEDILKTTPTPFDWHTRIVTSGKTSLYTPVYCARW